ncbi:MAG: FAD-dependent thymidylate synthase [Candidatus Riflebacteria bacterium]|nr:FAD-dependent thymidylate synthase [Candidatus Riflebacteria bacterium]
MLDVLLLRHTPDPDRLVALAARRCYSSLSATAIEERLEESEINRLLAVLRRRNHLSPFEHADFTFSVGGVSRALSHQLVRHRIASYSQESQRYVEYLKRNDLPFVTPVTIRENAEALRIYEKAMKAALEAYAEMRTAGIPAEDARYVFPNSVETKLVFTMNARSLFNFFEQRLCNKAQWEILRLAARMLETVKAVAPRIFRNAGAPCMYEKPYCREDDVTCPRFPKNDTPFGKP